MDTMTTNLIKKELVHISHKLYQKGYTQTTGGNVSCRVPGTDLVVIKKSAVSFGEADMGDMLVVDMDGEVVEGDGKPSKEMNFHLGILKVRPDVNAVVHCHPNYCIAFANTMDSLPLVTVTARKALGRVPCVPSALAGSSEIAGYVTDAFANGKELNCILMCEHGICTAAATPEAAYNLADLAEGTAIQAFLTMQIKGTCKE